MTHNISAIGGVPNLRWNLFPFKKKKEFLKMKMDHIICEKQFLELQGLEILA